MRRLAIVAGLVSAALGCNDVFGVAGWRHTPDAFVPPADAPLDMVSGYYRDLYTTNNADLTSSTLTEIFPASTLALSVTLDDGSTPTVDYNAADGTFSFGLAHAGQSYRFVINNILIGQVIEYDVADPTLEIVTRYAGRPNRTPPTKTTIINFSYSLPGVCTAAAPCYQYVESTGLWTVGSNSTTTGTFQFNWAATGSESGTLGLLDASQNDALYLMEIQGQPTSAPVYDNIVGSATSQITQQDGVASSVGNGNTRTPMAPVAINKCAHVLTAFNDELSRLTTALPAQGYTLYADNVQLSAVPDETLGPVAPNWLATYGQNGTSVPIANTDMIYDFGNPFPGSDLLAEFVMVAQMQKSVPGTTTPYPANNETQAWIEAPPLTGSCSANIVTLAAGGTAIASVPTLAGVTLKTDGMTVMLDPATDPVVTWSTAGVGPLDYSVALLVELTASGGATVGTTLYTILTHDQFEVVFPRALFQTGHYYMIRIDDHVGFPNAHSGDFSVVTYPYVTSNTWSHWFVASTTGT